MPKFRMTKKLAEKIETIPMIRDHLNAINPEEFGPRDKPLVEYLSKRGERFFPPGHDLRSDWKDFIDSFQPVFGLECERNVIAAAILAGAAIARPDIFLRQDLSENIRQQRANYQNQQDSPLGGSDLSPDRPPELLTPSGPPTPFAKQIVDEYKELTKNITPNGAFDSAIKQLLSSPDKNLRLGWRLKNLDLDALEQAIEEYFRKPTTYEADAGVKEGDSNKWKDSWAPENLNLSTLRFKCIKRRNQYPHSHAEDNIARDNIFWVVNVRSLENIQQIYNQIDNAIKNNRDKLEIKGLKWKEATWQSELFEIKKDGEIKEFHKDVFSEYIHNGFCLWSASIICVEANNAEYEAMRETLNNLTEYAAALGAGAAITVLASGGVSPVAAGAAIVASAAAFVALSAKVASAIVSILNFFDDNDVIDCKVLNNNDDYAVDDKKDIKNGDFDYDLSYIEESGPANYVLYYRKIFTGEKNFNRAWRVKSSITGQKSYYRRGYGFGNSGDITVTLEFPEKVDQIVYANVLFEPDGKKRHAHWKPPWSETQRLHPEPLNNNKGVEGTVHWGVTWANKITFYPYAQGIKFLRRL